MNHNPASHVDGGGMEIKHTEIIWPPMLHCSCQVSQKSVI